MINWADIARAVGSLDQDNHESGSFEMARAALELVLGTEALRDAVDFYIAYQPGSELVRHVLWLLHPWSAMQYCYEIYKSQRPREDRVAAIELLSVVADVRGLQWVEELLDDPEPDLQYGGVRILDQLLWGGGIQEERCSTLLEKARTHPNPRVRDHAASIDSFLRNRNE